MKNKGQMTNQELTEQLDLAHDMIEMLLDVIGEQTAYYRDWGNLINKWKKARVSRDRLGQVQYE